MCEEEDESGDGSEEEAKVHVEYETDEDEFEEDVKPGTGGPCHQYGGGAPHQQTNTGQVASTARNMKSDQAG